MGCWCLLLLVQCQMQWPVSRLLISLLTSLLLLLELAPLHY
jgi:hypothetical protein